jgi:putative transposase
VRRVPRRPRSELPDEGVFHLVARGVDSCAIVRDDDDRRGFLGQLGDSLRRFDLSCYAFCLMNTHYHLVAEGQLAAISRALHRLNFLHAQRFNRRHERTGHLFGDRFSAWLIWDERHLENTCNYVLANPVRAGLCEYREDWPWSGPHANRMAA